MAGGKYVGLWGNLGGQTKGVVTYGLSPNYQRAYAHLTDGIMYTLTKRIRGLGYAIVGLVPWYFAFQFTADQMVRSVRKNPQDSSYSRTRGY